MIQLALGSFRAELSPSQIDALRAEFREYHTLHLPNFLAPELLAFVQQRLPDADFKPRPHGKIAMELSVDRSRNIGIQTLQLRMNDRRLADLIEEITEVRPLKHFDGRVYRMLPGGDHYDSWHDDIADGRRVGVSINLSPAPYQGGVFTIRRVDSKEIIRPLPNLGPGDVNLFRIDDNLQHMVTRVEGAAAKTAFAGWFHDHDSMADFLRKPATGEVTT